jgi:hypothetical protein
VSTNVIRPIEDRTVGRVSDPRWTNTRTPNRISPGRQKNILPVIGAMRMFARRGVDMSYCPTLGLADGESGPTAHFSQQPPAALWVAIS